MSGIHRNLKIYVLLDANRINSRQKLPWMNQLDEWADNDVIRLQMSETSQSEAARGGEKQCHKAMGYSATETLAESPHEELWLQQIEEILFGKAEDESQRNDVDIVFNAKKYGAILVTNDGDSKRQPRGVLGCRDELKNRMGICVMTDEEAVAHIKDKIAQRDENARKQAEMEGTPVPDWVGRD